MDQNMFISEVDQGLSSKTLLWEILIMFSSLLLGVLISELSRLMSLHKRSFVYEDWTNFSKTLKCSTDIDKGLCYHICWCCDLLENIKVFEKLRMKIFQRWSNLALHELENKLKKTKVYVIFLDNELFTGILCSSEKVVCVVEDTKWVLFYARNKNDNRAKISKSGQRRISKLCDRLVDL